MKHDFFLARAMGSKRTFKTFLSRTSVEVWRALNYFRSLYIFNYLDGLYLNVIRLFC